MTKGISSPQSVQTVRNMEKLQGYRDGAKKEARENVTRDRLGSTSTNPVHTVTNQRSQERIQQQKNLRKDSGDSTYLNRKSQENLK